MEGCRVLTTVIMSLKRQNIMAEYLLNNATMNVTVSKFTWAIFERPKSWTGYSMSVNHSLCSFRNLFFFTDIRRSIDIFGHQQNK